MVVVVGVFRLLCWVMWLDRLPTRWQSVVVVSGLAVLIVAVWFFVAHVVPGLLSHDHAGGGRSSASGESSEPGAAGPSGKPAPPPLPSAAREQTEAGAAAFVEHYVDIENYVQRTNDVAPAKELFDPKACEGCQVVVENHELMNSKGKHLYGGMYRVRSTEAKKIPSGNYLVLLAVDREATKTFGNGGNQIGAEEPAISNQRVYFYLDNKEGRWSILDFKEAK